MVAHGDSRGEAAVINALVRVSGRQKSHIQPSVLSVAPAGAPSSVSFLFPWLTPWATFGRRYAAGSGYISGSLHRIGRHSSAATRVASVSFLSPRLAPWENVSRWLAHSATPRLSAPILALPGKAVGPAPKGSAPPPCSALLCGSISHGGYHGYSCQRQSLMVLSSLPEAR